MVAQMLEIPCLPPKGSKGTNSGKQICISLASAMSAWGAGDSNSNASDAKPGAPISLADAMHFGWDNDLAGASNNQIAPISLAQAICATSGRECSLDNFVSPAPAREVNPNTCISLAQAIHVEVEGKSGDLLGAGGDGDHSNRISLAEAVAFAGCDHHVQIFGGTTAKENDPVTSAGAPVQLTLAHMLNEQDHTASKSSSCLNPSAEIFVEPPYSRQSSAAPFTLSLSEELPTPADHMSQSPWIFDQSHLHQVGLHATGSHPPAPQVQCSMEARIGTTGAPGLGPPPLFLADHLGGEDSSDSDVKEDFLATPLPFIGCVM